VREGSFVSVFGFAKREGEKRKSAKKRERKKQKKTHLNFFSLHLSFPPPRNQTKPNQTKPNQTKPNQTKPNQTKPNQTKPNQTKPNKTKHQGQPRLLPPAGLPRPQGRHQGQARLRPCRGRPGEHGPARSQRPHGHGRLLRLRRGLDLLPLPDLRAPVHLLAGDDHPAQPGRRPAKGVGDAVRGPLDGRGLPGRRPRPEQARGATGEDVPGEAARVRDVHRGQGRGARVGRVPLRPADALLVRPGGLPGPDRLRRRGPWLRPAHGVRRHDARGPRGLRQRQGRRGRRAGGAARQAGPRGAPADLPPRRRRDVPQHHPHQQAAAFRDRDRRGLRRVRLQPTGEDVPAPDGVGVARRDVRGDDGGVPRAESTAGSRDVFGLGRQRADRLRGNERGKPRLRRQLVPRLRRHQRPGASLLPAGPRGARQAAQGPPQGLLLARLQARARQAGRRDARRGRLPARERLLRRHREGLPRPAVRVQGAEQEVEGEAGRGEGRRGRAGGAGGGGKRGRVFFDFEKREGERERRRRRRRETHFSPSPKKKTQKLKNRTW